MGSIVTEGIDFDGMVKGSHIFYLAAVNEVFRDNNLPFATINQSELEEAIHDGTLNLRGTYVDTGICLRALKLTQDLDKYLVKKLKKEVRKKLPAYIPAYDLILERDDRADEKLSFGLRKGALLVHTSILNKYSGYFRSVERRTGFPRRFIEVLGEEGDRHLQNGVRGPLDSKNPGYLSNITKMSLGESYDLYADEYIGDSDDNGRVIIVKRKI
ncbi:MAG: hypothetical protein RL557_301 [archaeon]